MCIVIVVFEMIKIIYLVPENNKNKIPSIEKCKSS